MRQNTRVLLSMSIYGLWLTNCPTLAGQRPDPKAVLAVVKELEKAYKEEAKAISKGKNNVEPKWLEASRKGDKSGSAIYGLERQGWYRAMEINWEIEHWVRNLRSIVKYGPDDRLSAVGVSSNDPALRVLAAGVAEAERRIQGPESQSLSPELVASLKRAVQAYDRGMVAYLRVRTLKDLTLRLSGSPSLAEMERSAPTVPRPNPRHHGNCQALGRSPVRGGRRRMRTGKTLISLGSVFTHAIGRRFTALAMVPPQMVDSVL